LNTLSIAHVIIRKKEAWFPASRESAMLYIRCFLTVDEEKEVGDEVVVQTHACEFVWRVIKIEYQK
jgi:hypothetical protein